VNGTPAPLHPQRRPRALGSKSTSTLATTGESLRYPWWCGASCVPPTARALEATEGRGGTPERDPDPTGWADEVSGGRERELRTVEDDGDHKRYPGGIFSKDLTASPMEHLDMTIRLEGMVAA